MTEYLTFDEAARGIGRSRSFINSRALDGELKFVKIGKHRFIEKKELERFKEEYFTVHIPEPIVEQKESENE